MNDIIDFSTANFIQFSLAQGHALKDVLTKPTDVATRMGLTLNASELAQIAGLSSMPVRAQLTALSPEAKAFIKDVLADGRYALSWKAEPAAVAAKLGLSIAPEVIDELDAIDLEDLLNPEANPVAGVKIAIISIAIAVVLGSASIGEDQFPVVDFSKLEKL